MATQKEYVQAFNQLLQHQQIVAILIQEEWEDQPNLVEDCYLPASKHLQERAAIKVTSHAEVTSILMREVGL